MFKLVCLLAGVIRTHPLAIIILFMSSVLSFKVRGRFSISLEDDVFTKKEFTALADISNPTNVPGVRAR